MPGSSWVSLGKKKPPASSIAGTHEAPEPPSITYPPYSSGESKTPSAVASTPNGYPSSNATSTAATPSSYAVKQADNTSGYSVGPYGTGGSSTGATQDNFYKPSYPPAGGPVASTADARANAYPRSTSMNGMTPPTSGFPSSTAPNSSSFGGASGYSQPAASSYGTGGSGYGTGATTTPRSSVTTPIYPPTSPTNGYPAASPSSSYPTAPSSSYATPPSNSYPALPSSGYPTSSSTSPSAALPSSGASGYNAPLPSGYSTTPSGVAAPYNSPSNYGAPSGYGTPSGYAGLPNTGSSTAGGYSASQGFRPGSTGRGRDAFGPTPTRTASPAGSSVYPSTYAR